jgi:hypothetical protein
MPTVYAATNDGTISNNDNVDWATTRDAASGDTVNTAGSIIAPAYGTQGTGIGGAGYWGVYRSFFQFDVSAITDAISSAVLNIYIASGVGSTLRIVRMGRNFGTLGVGNFGEMTGFLAGSTMAGNVTDYIDSVHTTTSGYNAITLNAQARADILTGNIGNFNIAIVGNTYDYLNIDPGAGGSNIGGLVHNDFPGTTFDCYLEYEYPVASKNALAGSDFTRQQLRDKTKLTAGLAEDTLYEVLTVNNSPNQVYFTMEGDNLFRKPGEAGKGFYIETTNSASGSNVINHVQEAMHASFILAGATGSFSSASFLISSSAGTGTRTGNTIEIMATNSSVIQKKSESAIGVTVEIFDLT